MNLFRCPVPVRWGWWKADVAAFCLCGVLCSGVMYSVHVAKHCNTAMVNG